MRRPATASRAGGSHIQRDATMPAAATSARPDDERGAPHERAVGQAVAERRLAVQADARHADGEEDDAGEPRRHRAGEQEQGGPERGDDAGVGGQLSHRRRSVEAGHAGTPRARP